MGAVARPTGYSTEAVLLVVIIASRVMYYLYNITQLGALIGPCIIEVERVILVVSRHALRKTYSYDLH